jgi:hypothetical protein
MRAFSSSAVSSWSFCIFRSYPKARNFRIRISIGAPQIKGARISPTSKASRRAGGSRHSQRSAPRKITRATLK